jgi:hypothetical protein
MILTGSIVVIFCFSPSSNLSLERLSLTRLIVLIARQATSISVFEQGVHI